MIANGHKTNHTVWVESKDHALFLVQSDRVESVMP